MHSCVRSAAAALLLLHLLIIAAASTHQDYTRPGPCATTQQRTDVALPPDTGCGNSCSLRVTATLPVASPDCPAPAALPAVVIYSGFQLRSSLYAPYAQRLASHNLAALHYDLPLLHMVADAVEVSFLPHLLRGVVQQLGLQLDSARIGVAGHSRGAKLAALHLAGSAGSLRVAAAFLLDPVDSDNPSAVEALAGLNRTAAITGAGVSGPCNPVGRSLQGFWSVLGPGSWLEVLPGSGHLQFCAFPAWAVWWRALDALCHTGSNSHEHTIALTTPALVAWMASRLDARAGSGSSPFTTLPGAGQVAGLSSRSASSRRPQRGMPAQQQWRRLRSSSTRPGTRPSTAAAAAADEPLAAFFRWVAQERAAGEMLFDVKGSG